MTKAIEINGIYFEVINPRESIETKYVKHCSGKSLYNYYDKPNTTKIEIYNEWKQWADTTDNISYFGVTGANYNAFSLGFIIEHNGIQYLARITKEHNRLYKIN
jgi:hypothetical protein